MTSKLKPNFTQIPNTILDELLSVLSESELKVLLYICRRTYGFHKQNDRISTSQLMNGIRDKDGVHLDTGTGLSNKSILDSIKSLEKLGIIKTIQKGTQTKYFSLDTAYEKSTQEAKDLLMKNLHKPYVKSTQVLMKNLHIQNKEKESIQKKEYATVSQDVSNIIKLFETVDPKNKTYYSNKTQRSACEFMINEYGFENIEKVIKLLPMTNQQDYFPRITSPFELKEKWTKLAVALQSKQRKDDFSSILL